MPLTDLSPQIQNRQIASMPSSTPPRRTRSSQTLRNDAGLVSLQRYWLAGVILPRSARPDVARL